MQGLFMFSCAPSYLTTVRDLLRFAISQFETAKLFYGHGTQNAFDEAAYLILSTLYLPLDKLEPFLDAKLLPDEIAMVLKVIETRVMTRKPAAYLTHEAWLHDYRFYVDERVIVPRSFIAELLLQQLNPWVSFPELIHRGLDLCTGSGCLAIMMAEAFPDAQIEASDLSSDALNVAKLNVETYGLTERITLLHSDLFDEIKQTYDLIISNPPYVDALSIDALPEEYLHEPTMALGSGYDGLDMTRQILKQAAHFLNPEGLLIVEIGHNRDVLEQAYPHLPFTWLPTSGGDGFVFLLTREELESQL
jgi:ribosomal protein L3 glutamine methyltransferase